ncbi:putative quinol monooxygenase [Woodsholea maritima]|uniref:putative quinol monooxygenase n=1 Tax=Woodsholea maritima TaxID=240237 RepID=UPI00037128EE|nr:antibiotic biosynthesis monooxygenase family protein [Woodsholea maritima]
MSISVLVNFTVKAEALETFSALMDQTQIHLPQVEGCEGVRIFRHRETPPHFTLVEDWQSEAQHKAHIESLIASGQWADINAMLDAAPTTHYVHAIG